MGSIRCSIEIDIFRCNYLLMKSIEQRISSYLNVYTNVLTPATSKSREAMILHEKIN